MFNLRDGIIKLFSARQSEPHVIVYRRHTFAEDCLLINNESRIESPLSISLEPKQVVSVTTASGNGSRTRFIRFSTELQQIEVALLLLLMQRYGVARTQDWEEEFRATSRWGAPVLMGSGLGLLDVFFLSNGLLSLIFGSLLPVASAHWQQNRRLRRMAAYTRLLQDENASDPSVDADFAPLNLQRQGGREWA